MHRHVRTALTTLLVSATYYLGGIADTHPASPIAIVWSPSAILLAALLLAPSRTWWVYLLAATATHQYAITTFQPELPLVAMLGQVFGSAVQVVIAAFAVRRVAGGPPAFDSLRSLITFVLLAVIAVPSVIATLVASLFLLTGWVSNFWIAWRLWFLSDALPTLTVTPLVLLVVTRGMTGLRGAPLRYHAEFGVLALGLLAVGILGWDVDAASPPERMALYYAPLPFLLWAAVRFGLGGLCLSLLTVALLSASHLMVEPGPFASSSPSGGALQIFLIALSLPLMFLAVLVEERQNNGSALLRSTVALRASDEHVHDLLARLVNAQEIERMRIARELHDDISQQLAAVSIDLSALKRQLHADPTAVADKLAWLQQRTVILVDTIGRWSHELHPGVLEHVGLVAALKAHCAEVERLHAMDVTLSAGAGLDAITPDVALCLYRVAQEALRNVSAHAGARQVHITLRPAADGVEMIVADDGRGFDLSEERRRGGLGLISCEERVRLVGGSLRINTQPQRGTELWIHVPLGAHEQPERPSATSVAEEALSPSLDRATSPLAEGVGNPSQNLRSDVLTHVGLAASLTAYCNELSLPHSAAITCHTQGDFESVDPEIALGLYRIAQEALHNVASHAEARQVRVRLLRRADSVELIVADDGKGFDSATRDSVTGLVSVTEQARLLGGTTSVITALNIGTQVRVRVPSHAGTTTNGGDTSIGDPGRGCTQGDRAIV